MMSHYRFVLASRLSGLFAVALGALLGTTMCLADPPPKDSVVPDTDSTTLRLKASRAVGFAPLLVEVEGEFLDHKHRQVVVELEEELMLRVETHHVRVTGGDRSSPLYHGGSVDLEEDDGADANPMKRRLIINRPGTYTLRFVVDDGTGKPILSNGLRVRVL